MVLHLNECSINPSLVEIGPVVLEKKKTCEKITDILTKGNEG